ncbi:hypothetical protein Tco_0677191, partial [Tanacetum coccineum]
MLSQETNEWNIGIHTECFDGNLQLQKTVLVDDLTRATAIGMKRISEKRTKNQAKNDKTEHEMEKRGNPESQ